MMKSYTQPLFWLLVFSFSPSFGQHVASVAREKPILKLSFLPAFHIDNAFVLGAELPLSGGRFSLQPEIGYGSSKTNIWYEWWYTDELRPDKNTIRTKLQFRAYIIESRVFRAYVGGEYAYRHNNYLQDRNAEPENTNPTEMLKLQRVNHAMHGLFGWQGYFSNRLTLDFHVGFGLRMSKNHSLTKGLSATELDAIRIEDRFWWGRSRRLEHFGPFPSLIGGVQLGFILGKVK